MVVREGFTSTDPFSGSSADRAKTSAWATYRRPFFAWCVALAAGLVACRILVGWQYDEPDMLVQAWMRGMGGAVAFGAAVYSFVRFALARELRMLWTAAAFSTLAGGAMLQTVAETSAGNSPVHVMLSTSVWLVAAAFFLGSAASRGRWTTATRKEAIGTVVAGAVLVVAFPVTALPYVFDSSLLFRISATGSGALLCYVIDYAARFLAPVLLILAILGYYRRLRDDSNSLAYTVCYFLVTCLAGLISRLFSTVPYDQWWIVSFWTMALSWIVLLTGAQIRTAYAYQETRDRVAELEVLHNVSWSLVGAGTSGDLLDQFAHTLVDEVGARAAGVYTSVDDGQKLRLAAVCGLGEDSPHAGTVYTVVCQERRPGFHTGHTALAFTSTEVQIASNVFVDVEFVPWKVIAQDDGCAVSIPLVNHGNPIGVLSLYLSSAKQLTRQRLKLFATIAAAAAPAIESALARDRSADMEDDPVSIRLAA